MSISETERAVINTNSDAFTQALGNDFYNLCGVTENQANKIFRNLDTFEANDSNDYKEAIQEYRKVFNQYNKSDVDNDLPDLKLVDFDKDGDLDIQLMDGKNVKKTFEHK